MNLLVTQKKKKYRISNTYKKIPFVTFRNIYKYCNKLIFNERITLESLIKLDENIMHPQQLICAKQ